MQLGHVTFSRASQLPVHPVCKLHDRHDVKEEDCIHQAAARSWRQEGAVKCSRVHVSLPACVSKKIFIERVCGGWRGGADNVQLKVPVPPIFAFSRENPKDGLGNSNSNSNTLYRRGTCIDIGVLHI